MTGAPYRAKPPVRVLVEARSDREGRGCLATLGLFLLANAVVALTAEEFRPFLFAFEAIVGALGLALLGTALRNRAKVRPVLTDDSLILWRDLVTYYGHGPGLESDSEALGLQSILAWSKGGTSVAVLFARPDAPTRSVVAIIREHSGLNRDALIAHLDERLPMRATTLEDLARMHNPGPLHRSRTTVAPAVSHTFEDTSISRTRIASVERELDVGAAGETPTRSSMNGDDLQAQAEAEAQSEDDEEGHRPRLRVE